MLEKVARRRFVGPALVVIAITVVGGLSLGGCASDSQAAKGATEGAGTGALAGAVSG
nr:hypothetical protein [Desulfuromonadales bacterium]